MKRLAILVVALGWLCPINICAFDQAPAASLLFPFVQYDFNQPFGGYTTVIGITNLSPESQIVRLSFWTDFGVPILGFNVILSGYDVQTINVRDILNEGRLPVTLNEAHAGSEGSHDEGPVSGYGGPGVTWTEIPDPQASSSLGARCDSSNAAYPGLYSVGIPQAILELFQIWLQASQTVDRFYTDDCDQPFEAQYLPEPQGTWFENRTTSGPSWLYITVDVVHSCGKSFPSDPAYWTPAAQGGEARYDNVLMGEAFWISGGDSTAAPAVHLEADEDLASVVARDIAGDPISFYSRYSSAAGATSDMREPLPTAWAFRYVGYLDDTFDTAVRMWKGSTRFESPIDMETTGTNPERPDMLTATTCLAYTYYGWDNEENVLSYSCPGGDCGPAFNLFPLATQEVSIDELFLPDSEGWVLFVWPSSNYPEGAGIPPTPDHYQTWMGASYHAWERHSDFLQAMPVANANCFSDQRLPDLGIDYDYVDQNGYREGP
jgi:hypothetical protein